MRVSAIRSMLVLAAFAAGLGCGGGLIPYSGPDTSTDVSGDATDVLDPDGTIGTDSVDPTDSTTEVGTDATDATDVADTTDTSDVPVVKPFLSARKAVKSADLLEGENAYGTVGNAYVLENSKVRFLIQDKDVAVHLFVYGGNVIDADVQRGVGADYKDQWREIFPIVGYRVPSTDKVEVISDGSDGQAAVIRVTGSDMPTGIIKILDDLAQPLGVTIRTDYILHPDVPHLLMRTEVENPNAAPLTEMMVGDFLAFGGAQSVFTVEGGFGGDVTNTMAMMSSGRGASYGYTVKTGTIGIPIVDASGTVGMLGTNFAVASKGKSAFDRYLVVGDGDIASVLEDVHALRGMEVARVSGIVKDEAGKVLPGALVTAFASGKGSPGLGGAALNQAVAGKDGTYAMTLPVGKYDLVVSAAGRLRIVKTVDAVLEGAVVDAQLAAAGWVGLDVHELDATDKDIGRIPAKASLACLNGTETPWDAIGEKVGRDLCAVLFTNGAIADKFLVKPGHYKVTVSRGPEYEVFEDVDVEVKAGDTVWIEPKIQRSVDTAGWISTDLHQHTLGSLDAPVSPWDRIIENLAEGVEAPARTEHDMLLSYTPTIQSMKMTGAILGIDGDEVSVNGVGHFNLFGAQGVLINANGTPGALFDFAGAGLFANRTVAEIFEAMRSVPGASLVAVNHPRDGMAGYFSFLKFDPTTGGTNGPEAPVFDFDLFEVKGSLGTPQQFLPSEDANISKLAAWGSEEIPVLMDWFALLNMGYDVCATAVSDAHQTNDGVGYGRNLVRVGKNKDSATAVTATDILAALKAQKSVVSNGPFVQVWHDNVEKMGASEVISLGDRVKKTVTVRVRVQAPSWMDVSSLEVYANGRPLPLHEVAGKLFHQETAKEGELISTDLPIANTVPTATVRADVEIEMYPTVDTWYVFAVKGTVGLSPVGDGTPFAFTNPVYVDLDGKGFEAPMKQ